MTAKLMVVIDGIRYRREDAKRLGLSESGDGEARKAKAPHNKSRSTVSNKTAEPSGDDEE